MYVHASHAARAQPTPQATVLTPIAAHRTKESLCTCFAGLASTTQVVRKVRYLAISSKQTCVVILYVEKGVKQSSQLYFLPCSTQCRFNNDLLLLLSHIVSCALFIFLGCRFFFTFFVLLLFSKHLRLIAFRQQLITA